MPDLSRYLLLSDVDGTALVSESGVPPQNVEAVREWMALGGRFTFATGRSLSMLGIAVDAYPINAPVIVLNGALICAPDGSGVLEDHPFAPGALDMARRVCERFEGTAGVLAVARNAYYAVSRTPASLEMAMRNNESSPIPRRLDDIGEPLYKLVVRTRNAADADSAREWLGAAVGGEYTVARSGVRFVEIQESGVDKGPAALSLGRRLGVPRENIAAIGDNENDAGMLRAAGISAAPGDCAPAAAREAAHILCGCMDGALAEFVRLLIRTCGVGEGPD